MQQLYSNLQFPACAMLCCPPMHQLTFVMHTSGCDVQPAVREIKRIHAKLM